ncbi:hypothetical protein [Massilia phosphatilytica]
MTKITLDHYTHETDYKTITITSLVQQIKHGDKNADPVPPLPIIPDRDHYPGRFATPIRPRRIPASRLEFALTHYRGRRRVAVFIRSRNQPRR